MAYSDWLFVLVIMVMTSSTREQATCSRLRAVEGTQQENGNDPSWRICCQEEGCSSTTQPSPSTQPSFRPSFNTDPPPGVGYLGRGFDVYRGNLLSTNTDTGFRLPVVSLTYTKRRTTSDYHYLLPDDTDLLYITASHVKQPDEITEVRTHTDLLRMINQRIQLQSPDIQDGRFMASHAYTAFRSPPDMLLYRVAERPEYGVMFEGQGQKASQAFTEAVLQLPSACSSTQLPAYLELIHTYGTHVVSHVALGKMVARYVTLPTEQLIRDKFDQRSVEDVFSQTLNTTSMRNSSDEGDTVVPLSVSIEPLDHFFTHGFLGLDTIGILSKRRCLIQAVTVYCQTVTPSLCQPSASMSHAIRYGDIISFSTGLGQSVYIGDDLVVIGSGTGLRLIKGASSSKSANEGSFRVLPAEGLEIRLGEPLYTGDVFTLAERSTSRRIQVTQTAGLAHIQDPLTSTPVYFRDVRYRSLQRNRWELFLEKNEGRPYHISVITAMDGQTVTGAGPWSLTIQTAHSVLSLLIDPCRHLCHPAGVTGAIVTLPLGDEHSITGLQLLVVPPVLALPVRAGNWSVQKIQLTDIVTKATYTTGTAIMQNPCVLCTTSKWSIDDGSLLFYQPETSDITKSLNAEFYFGFSEQPLGGIVVNESSVRLHLVGYIGSTNSTTPAHIPSCSENPCHNGGQCKTSAQGTICECRAFWTGPTCHSACFAELFTIASINQSLAEIPGLYGSSGQPSSSTTEWIFPALNVPLPFVVILLPTVAHVSGLIAPHSLPLQWVDIHYVDVADGVWKSDVTVVPVNSAAQSHSLSVSDSLGLTTDKLKLTFKGGGGALDLGGLVIYGCAVPSKHPTVMYVEELLAGTFSVTKSDSYIPHPLPDRLREAQLNTQSPLVSEKLTVRVVIDPSMTCDLNVKSVQWSVAQQINLCPSNIVVTNLTLPTASEQGQTLASIELTLTGDQATVSSAVQLINATNLTMSCQGAEKVSDINGDIREKLSLLEVRLTVLSSVVIVLMVLCLIVFVVALVAMSRRYRDINNELTTIRKLKMQKRIAKRQELQPQVPVPQASFTLPRPNSTASSMTTSIPGRLNGQTRSLRYSQSLHGHGDRPRLEPLAPMAAVSGSRASLDPSNYIIANPHPVRTPSPVGTKSGEDSDTVQSIC